MTVNERLRTALLRNGITAEDVSVLVMSGTFYAQTQPRISYPHFD